MPSGRMAPLSLGLLSGLRVRHGGVEEHVDCYFYKDSTSDAKARKAANALNVEVTADNRKRSGWARDTLRRGYKYGEPSLGVWSS